LKLRTHIVVLQLEKIGPTAPKTSYELENRRKERSLFGCVKRESPSVALLIRIDPGHAHCVRMMGETLHATCHPQESRTEQ
jgi:hypothetical protein